MPVGRSVHRGLFVSAVAVLLVALQLSGEVVARERPSAKVDTAGDRLAVIELSSRYAWGIDTLDRKLLSKVFTPDAVADYVGVGKYAKAIHLNQHLVGFDAIYQWLSANLGRRKGTAGLPWHFMTNQVVDLHGDTADLRFYQHNRPMAGGGVYYVHAVRTPEGWRIDRLRLEEQIWKPDFYLKRSAQ